MMQVIGLAVQAWFVGLTVAAVQFLPAATAFDGLTTDPFLENLAKRVLAFVAMIAPSLLMTMTIGVVVSFPFFLIGTLVALLGTRLIMKYPMTMAALAPVCTVVIIAGASAATRDNQWARAHDFLERFLQIAVQGDNLLFALPVAAGSYYFCSRLARLKTGDLQP